MDLKVDQQHIVKVRNKDYPFLVSGRGIPCLVIGTGTIVQRTLSQKFKTNFEVFSSDLYWSKDHQLSDLLTLNMQQILEDIEELRKNLGLSSFILIGHSAYGIVALEYAKQFFSALLGIVLIGTPLNSNAEVAAHNNQFFEINADPLRKQIDLERRTKFANEDLSHLDSGEKFLREYIWRDASRYWHDPSFDCTSLWKDITIDGKILNHFFTSLLPHTDVQKEVDKIKCPIFIAAGMSDYDCCPWMWSEIINPPPELTVYLFEKSGHYPHYEEANLFDERIELWAKNLISKTIEALYDDIAILDLLTITNVNDHSQKPQINPIPLEIETK